jgi:hypothetical protein
MGDVVIHQNTDLGSTRAGYGVSIHVNRRWCWRRCWRMWTKAMYCLRQRVWLGNGLGWLCQSGGSGR